MARLVSYRAKDENRYSTFGGETSCNSSENLTETNRIKLMFKNNKHSTNSAKIAKTDENKISSLEQAVPSKSHIETVQTIIKDKRVRPPTATKSKFRCCSLLFCAATSLRPNKCNCNSKCGNCSHCWWHICCCGSKCCKRKCLCNANDDDDDDDDDIDAKFEQYKYEMKLNELNSNANEINIDNSVADVKVPQYQMNEQRSIATPSPISSAYGKKDMMKPKKFRYRKYWNWNDSLRSNSDKFLETLEYDMDGEQSLKRNIICKNPDIFITRGGFWLNDVFFSLFFLFSITYCLPFLLSALAIY